jgi:MSHA biogenesis protein MshI
VVLDKLKPYFYSLSHWKELLFHSKTNQITTDGMCCIEIDAQSFSIAYARYEKEKINLVSCANYPYTTPEDLQNSLLTIVKYYHLETVYCSWVLQPDQYQILLLDALPVPANEFQAAVRWKIKDLIRFPINDVVIDSFPLPIKKVSTDQDMIMVVVAKTSYLKSMSEKLQAAGLHLNKIDILEMSLRNVAALFNQEDKIIALIYMQEKNAQLIITTKKQLHFARRIELGLSFIEPAEGTSDNESEVAKKIDRLALEIQRSFDYYQSQWRQSIPTHIIFSAVKSISIDIASLLSQRLSISTEMLNISRYFSDTRAVNTQEQGKYLTIIGELFQHEGSDHVATN